jgi:putative heme-binding domain-containing protein
MEVAASEPLPINDRISALRDIALGRPPEGLHLLPVLIKRKTERDSLRIEAVRALSGYDKAFIAKDLLSEWKSYPAPVKSEVVQLLISRREWSKDLLGAIGSSLVPRTELNDNHVLRMRAFNDNDINAQIEKVWGRFRPTPKELNELIDKTRGQLAEASGSFARGKLVFENQCAKCHKFDGKGNEVGPPLDGAGRDIEYLLANILDPNRVIGAPYFLRSVYLADGRVEQGVIVEEDNQKLSIKVENAVVKTFAKKDIEMVKIQEKSMMPEGLGYDLKVQDFRDLIRYVMAHPFLTNVEVRVSGGNGKIEKPDVGVSGRIILPETKEDSEVLIEAEVTSPEMLRTKLLIGSRKKVTIRLNGTVIGEVQGTGKEAQPDQGAVDVELRKGKNRISISLTHKGKGESIFARFLDPDRKLIYPDSVLSKKE